ncbi:hypothetical protein IC757_10360 [Wenzhouxiangella sp. AB-CW3]|uniref:hypothetical protein n=1 Tax=Wenzhouxiangella sp. AB-CW3 TaxID=2771012 RepID=UPI00168AAA28|nr:hypothetical protein [Wenzhouxiangella sp. AB-CW3]QOC21456.1 hypothetical protein IC757_10360 [Wenzhouxiangella sp. AB-CW3]
MSLITSTEDAALLDAVRLAAELAQRYQYSVDHLIEPAGICHLLSRRAATLEDLNQRLTNVIHQAGLLPREPDLEMSELRTLADQFSSWLDDPTCSKLLDRFAEVERELLNELNTARGKSKSERKRLLDEAIEQIEQFLQQFSSS